MKKCEVCNKTEKEGIITFFRKKQYFCCRHYGQMTRYGKILERTKFDPNEIIDCGDYYEICLYSGLGKHKEVARTKIDKEDLDKIKNYKWNLRDKNFQYATSHIDGKTVHLHRLILNLKETNYKIIVDHKNQDGLDNRKNNLRLVTRSQNGINSKKTLGAWFNKKNKKWYPEIFKDGIKYRLGTFINKEDALKAREKKEKELYGIFAQKRCY